jgi:hypothetical protein
VNERALSELFIDELDRLDVSDPFQRLQIELEKPGAARARQGRRIFMTRNRTVLLAAALVLIIGVTIFVSARAFSGLHPGTTVPAGGTGKTAVEQLLARPIQFNHIAAGQTCPAGGPHTDVLEGAGPVYIGLGSTRDTDTSWGHYGSSTILTPPGMVGPVLIRATDLSSGQPLVHVGPYAAGPAVGTDNVNGGAVTRHNYTVLDTDHPPTTTYDVFNTPYVQWPEEYGWAHTSTGFCVGVQIDGPSFTELIRDHVTPS